MDIKKPKVSSHDDGKLVYFNNVLVRSNDLNSYTDFKFWQEVAEKNPEFCPRQYHKHLTCEKCTCKKDS